MPLDQRIARARTTRGQSHPRQARQPRRGIHECWSFSTACGDLPPAEAEDKAGEQFGVERLEDAIGASGQPELGGVVDAIIATVGRFRGAAKQSDDMTVMLVSRNQE